MRDFKVRFLPTIYASLVTENALDCIIGSGAFLVARVKLNIVKSHCKIDRVNVS
jgi:hypothetical protein